MFYLHVWLWVVGPGDVTDDMSPWVVAEEHGLHGGGCSRIGIARSLDEQELIKLLQQMSKCTALTTFTELPFGRRPYAVSCCSHHQ